MSAPVRYTPGVEQFAADEDEAIAEINGSFDEILETTSKDYGRAVRAVHAKGHAVLKGTLTVDQGLPSELAQGLFATPGEHALFARISTNAGDILDDSIGLPRGLALKILDVTGERLPGAAGETQDFILVNGKTFQAKTAAKFGANLKLLAKTTDRIEGTKKFASTIFGAINSALTAVGLSSPTLAGLGGAPNVHPLGETYFSVAPFRYGDLIAKFSVAPVSSDLTALTGTIIDATDRPNAIRERIAEDMPGIDGMWELRVQLCRDLEKQPVEDPTVEWDEQLSPFQRVGTIHLPPQASWAPDMVALVDEDMRFSVWTGLAAHQPLGNINRARKAAYDHSAAFRARFNGCPMHEPN